MEVINQKKANKLNIIKNSCLTEQQKYEYYQAFLFSIFSFNNWFLSEEQEKEKLQQKMMGKVCLFNNREEVIFSCNLIHNKWEIYTFYNDNKIIKVNFHTIQSLTEIKFLFKLKGFNVLFNN